MAPSQTPCRRPSPCVGDKRPTPSGCSPAPRVAGNAGAAGCPAELPVYIHVYDVSNESYIQQLNALFAHKSAPFRLGGVFHAGVEIAGREWTYGHTVAAGTGVTWREPRTDPQHHYRETVNIGSTRLSVRDVGALLEKLTSEYQGNSYSLLGKNCCHFAEEFCQRLGVGSLPPWVHRLSRMADSVGKVSQSLEKHLTVVCPASESGAQAPHAHQALPISDSGAQAPCEKRKVSKEAKVNPEDKENMAANSSERRVGPSGKKLGSTRDKAWVLL